MGLVIHKGPGYVYVASLFQLAQVRAQVAVGQIQHIFEVPVARKPPQVGRPAPPFQHAGDQPGKYEPGCR